MARKYFGFALADSMFAGMEECVINRRALSIPEAATLIAEDDIGPCLNPSHKATIDAMQSRFGIHVEIPRTPPRVQLAIGDSLIVMGVRGLPRLTDRHEYSEKEIAEASFSFSLYTVA